jgi:hypothetical protein
MRSLHCFLVSLAAVALLVPAGFAQPAAGPANKAAKSKNIIVLVDRSESIGPLGDCTQPMLCHLLKLAELSGEPVRFTVIFFGGEGIRVVPSGGVPTPAHRNLLNELTKAWPKPAGGTPLDEAMQEAVRIITALPKGSDTAVILFTDGEPSSGRIRADAFADVKAEIDRQLKAAQAEANQFPPAIVQQLQRNVETELMTPGTARFQKLYQVQVKAEFQKTLDYAGALKKAGARFISVDYLGGIPALQEIHKAAGGTEKDLVLAKPPSSVIDKLHKLGLTALPRVVVQNPQSLAALPGTFERTVPLKLDSLGERALATLVFDPPLENFAKHAVLEATIGGNTLAFDPSNDDPSRTLSFDGTGRLVTAHLLLDHLPPEGQVMLTYRSPSGSLAVPACTAYVHLRVARDVVPEFRRAPYRLSPRQEVRWVAAFRSSSGAKAYSLKSLEAVLRHTHTGAEEAIGAGPDPQAPHTFVSEPGRVPRGTHDVTLAAVLESGAAMTLTLPRHVESEMSEEVLALEITAKVGDGVEHASEKPGHVDFGEVGDDCRQRAVAVTVRALNVSYAVSIDVGLDALADSRGTAPKQAWIVADRKQLLLQPGRPERIVFTLKLPEGIEDQLVDGPYKALLTFTRRDLNEPMPLKRYQRISGVPDDEPVDQVTFTLRRPQLIVSAPRCGRDTLRPGKDGRQVLPILVSVGKPFDRTVCVTVAHNSVLSRAVTAHVEAVFTDADGRQVPYVRLVAIENTTLTQEIAPGSSGSWTFHFAVDEPHDLRGATGRLTISSPRLAPVHVTVDVVPRRRLLGSIIKTALRAGAGLLCLLALPFLWRYLRARRFREGSQHEIGDEGQLADLFTVQLRKRATGGRLTFQRDCTVRMPGETTDRPRPASTDVKFAVADLQDKGALRVEEARDAEADAVPEPVVVSAIDCRIDTDRDERPRLVVEVEADGRFGEESARCRRRVVAYVLLAVLLLAAAALLYQPSGLRVAQWVVDFFTL